MDPVVNAAGPLRERLWPVSTTVLIGWRYWPVSIRHRKRHTRVSFSCWFSPPSPALPLGMALTSGCLSAIVLVVFRPVCAVEGRAKGTVQ